MLSLFDAIFYAILDAITFPLFVMLWSVVKHCTFVYCCVHLYEDEIWTNFNIRRAWSRDSTCFNFFYISAYYRPGFTFYVSMALMSLYGTRMLYSFWLRNKEDDEGYYDEEEYKDTSYFYTVVDEYPIEEHIEIPTECELYPKKSKPKLESYYSPGRSHRRAMMYSDSIPSSPPPSPTVYPAPPKNTFQQPNPPDMFIDATPRTTAVPVAVTPPPRAASATPPLRGILRRGRGGHSNSTVRKTARWSFTVQVREYGIRMGDVGICPKTRFSDLPMEFSDEIVQDSSFELMVQVVKNNPNKKPIRHLDREEKVRRLEQWGIVAPWPGQSFSPSCKAETCADRQEASHFCGVGFSDKNDSHKDMCLMARGGFVQERRQNPQLPSAWRSMEQWQHQFSVAGWREKALFYGKHQERLAHESIPLERVTNDTGRVMFRKGYDGASCSRSSSPVATRKRGRSDDDADAAFCHSRRRLLH